MSVDRKAVYRPPGGRDLLQFLSAFRSPGGRKWAYSGEIRGSRKREERKRRKLHQNHEAESQRSAEAIRGQNQGRKKGRNQKAKAAIRARRMLQRSVRPCPAVYRREPMKRYKQHEYHLYTDWRLSYPEHRYQDHRPSDTTADFHKGVSGNARIPILFSELVLIRQAL